MSGYCFICAKWMPCYHTSKEANAESKRNTERVLREIAQRNREYELSRDELMRRHQKTLQTPAAVERAQDASAANQKELARLAELHQKALQPQPPTNNELLAVRRQTMSDAAAKARAKYNKPEYFDPPPSPLPPPPLRAHDYAATNKPPPKPKAKPKPRAYCPNCGSWHSIPFCDRPAPTVHHRQYLDDISSEWQREEVIELRRREAQCTLMTHESRLQKAMEHQAHCYASKLINQYCPEEPYSELHIDSESFEDGIAELDGLKIRRLRNHQWKNDPLHKWAVPIDLRHDPLTYEERWR